MRMRIGSGRGHRAPTLVRGFQGSWLELRIISGLMVRLTANEAVVVGGDAVVYVVVSLPVAIRCLGGALSGIDGSGARVAGVCLYRSDSSRCSGRDSGERG